MSRLFTACLSLIVFFSGLLYAVTEPSAVEFVDMNTWEKKGPQNESNWTVQSGGKTVKQTVNGLPAFFVSTKEYINVTVMGTIKVDTTADDDWVGFVVGYQAPNVSTAANQEYLYQMILLDWKQANQGTAKEGFSLNQLSGNTTSSSFNDYFTSHNSTTHPPTSGTFTLLASDFKTTNGWADKVEYSFRIIHTTNAVRVRINNVEIFNHAVTFAGGKIGFYNYSQKDVIYGNVRIAPSSDTPAAPVATADVYGTALNTALSKDNVFGIVANDYDPNLDEFRINITSSGNFTGSYTSDSELKGFQTNSGNITLQGNGAFTYTPDTGFQGFDEFSYSVTDKWTTAPDGTSAAVKVEFYVVNNNVAPTDITASNNIIYLEDANDSLIGVLTATDANVGDRHEFLQDSQSTTALLTISGNQVKLNDTTKSGNAGQVHTITITAQDLNGATYQKTLKFVVRSRKPALSLFDDAPAYTENAAAVTLDSNTSILDYDNTTISGANLIVSANLLTSDLLAVNTAGTSITAAAFNSSTGLLQLSGSDTPANYTTVVQSATYVNSGDNPTDYGNKLKRTIELRATDGGNISTSSNIELTITAVNDAPDAVGVNTMPAFSEGAAALTIDSSVTVNDVDTHNLISANVVISANLVTGDTLAATGTGNITASWDATTGVLSLSGNGSLAQYKTVLQSVTFVTASENPSNYNAASKRTLSYQLHDGMLLSSANTIELTVSASNDAPALAHNATASYPTYTENGAAVALDAALTLSDVDNTQFTGGSVTISSNLVTGDTLSATTAGTSITATYTSGNGSLHLSGSDTLANYQSVLRSVSFSSTSDNPDNYGASRGRALTFAVNDGSASNTYTNGLWKVHVTTSNDAPVISNTSTGLSYTEEAAALNLASSLGVSDVDSLMLSGANVTISSNFLSGDTLIVDTSGTNIVAHAYDATTGLLRLSGLDTPANYQTALRKLQYQFSGHNPDDYGTKTARDITLNVFDELALGATGSFSVAIVATNDAPEISNMNGGTIGYAEKGAAKNVDTDLILSDSDHQNLTGATITVTDGRSTDVLGVVTTGTGITASFDANTSVLTLSGTATLAQYQQVLRTLKYNSTSSNPTDYSTHLTRTINVVLNDGALKSNTGTTIVRLTETDDSPVVTPSLSRASYTENAAATAIDSAMVVTDVDSLRLQLATLTISDNLQTHDLLSADTSGTSLTPSWDAATGRLTLSGNDTLVNYQTVLRRASFSSNSDNPDVFGTFRGRGIQVLVNDGSTNSEPVFYDLIITTSNDAPVISPLLVSTQGYAEGSATTTLYPVLKISDPDEKNLSSAQVVIGAALASDILSVDTTGTTIASSYNAATGVLSLTGNASVEHYQQVLRTVAYRSTSNNPAVTSKTITTTLSDGQASSAGVAVNVNITAKNDPPTVTAFGGTASYSENGAAVSLDTDLQVADVDSALLQSASIVIDDGYVLGDTLSVDTTGTTISVNYNSTSGVLTLTGPASPADFQRVIRTLAYSSTSDSPTAKGENSVKSLSLWVNDGSSNSSVVQAFVNVTDVADELLITFSVSAGAYTENAAATLVDSGIGITDADSDFISMGNITVAGNRHALDVLQIETRGTSITASWDATNARMQLSGRDTPANYQTVLRTLRFVNASEYPANGSNNGRILNFLFSDDGDLAKNFPFELKVTEVNDSPVISAQSSVAQTVAIGASYSFEVSTSDVDDSSFTYVLDGLPSWASFNSSTGKVSGTPGSAFASDHFPMKITVSDGRGGTDSLSFRMQIQRNQIQTVSNTLTQSLAIKVVNELGATISGALTQITGTENLAFTDTSGTSSLSVPTDTRAVVELRVSASGYVSHVQKITSPAGQSLTVVLKKGVIITGSVTNAGTALAGAKVVAWTEALGFFEVVTDTQGKFELSVPRQTSNVTWTLGASHEGYNFTSTSVEVVPTQDRVEVNLSALALTSTTLLSWETHRATDFATSREFQVVIKAQPGFKNGDELLGTLGLDGQQDQITGLSYDSDKQAIVFTFRVSPGETQVNIPIKLTPSGADQALSSVIFNVNDAAAADKDDTAAKVQQQVNPVIGGKADLSSRSVTDENGNSIIDYSGFELPPFGIRDEVNYIRMERTQRSSDFFTDSKFVGAVYSVDAFRIITDNNVETIEKLSGDTYVRKIYLSFRFDSTIWKPFEDRIFYSQDGGNIWVLFSNDNIINVDYEKEIVTVESTHLSLWVLGQPGDGLIGNAGGGSSGGGGCILKR